MSEIDDNIKRVLQSKIKQIDDDSFTKRIVDTYLENKQVVKFRPFANFLPFVIGLSFLFVSLGLVFVLEQNYNWINQISISLEEGFILVVISIVFLIYILIDEFFINNLSYNSLDKSQL
jgi:uncharacterized membrane protein